MTSKSGHMEKELAVTLRLRKHSGVRSNLHQLRHNVASTAEELGFPKSDIAELLGHTQSTVTDRYIDERVRRHRTMLTAINQHLGGLVADGLSVEAPSVADDPRADRQAAA